MSRSKVFVDTSGFYALLVRGMTGIRRLWPAGSGPQTGTTVVLPIAEY